MPTTFQKVVPNICRSSVCVEIFWVCSKFLENLWNHQCLPGHSFGGRCFLCLQSRRIRALQNVRLCSVVGICAISVEFVCNESTGELTLLWTTYWNLTVHIHITAQELILQAWNFILGNITRNYQVISVFVWMKVNGTLHKDQCALMRTRFCPLFCIKKNPRFY
jgi:hypothetical protein